MKINFIILDDLLHGLTVEATEKRVKNIVPYMSNTFINSGDEFVAGCDILIYQDRIEHHDLMMIKKLTSKTIILDLSLPVWNPYYPYSAKNILTYFYKMVKLCTVVVVSTENYKNDLQKQLPNQRIEVIPTGHDTKSYKDAANAYMDLIKSITSITLAAIKKEKQTRGLYLSPQDRLEELNKKTKMLILEEVE